jgi:hypothetical protein
VEGQTNQRLAVITCDAMDLVTLNLSNHSDKTHELDPAKANESNELHSCADV